MIYYFKDRMFYASYGDDIMSGYPTKEFVIDLIINCVFLIRSFCSIYRRNFVEFSVQFSMLDYFNDHVFVQVLSIHFSNELRYHYVLRILRRCFEKSRLTQGHATIVTFLTSRSRRDRDNLCGSLIVLENLLNSFIGMD